MFFFRHQKKINKIIPGFKKFFVGRKIVLCREISKLYEEYIRKNVDELELISNELKKEVASGSTRLAFLDKKKIGL